ncbi:hypothetical protein ACFX2K_003694 [Malus domestica]
MKKTPSSSCSNIPCAASNVNVKQLENVDDWFVSDFYPSEPVTQLSKLSMTSDDIAVVGKRGILLVEIIRIRGTSL